MEEGKVRKVWRLYFLVPLPTQPSQQAAGSATQESQTQIPFPQEQPSITWVFLSSAFPHGHALWRTEEVSQRKPHCSVAGSVQLLPPELFCPRLWSQIPQFSARPCLHGSAPRKTQVHQEVVLWLKADTIASQGQIKSRGFLSPMNFNSTRTNVVFSLYLRAVVRQQCTATSPGDFSKVLFLLKDPNSNLSNYHLPS